MSAAVPAFTVAAGLTVTVKVLVALQLPVAAVMVYNVVASGDNTGLATAALLTPVIGDHV